MKILASGKTDRGLKRKLNEDSLLVRPDLGLYIVADGVGGHLAGEVASRIVVDTMTEYWEKVRANQAPSFLQSIKNDIPLMAKHLVNSIAFTNIIIHEAQKRPKYHNMGSTVSAVIEDKETLWAANVGDSPIYFFLYQPKTLILVSEEHSVEAEQKNLGLYEDASSTDSAIKNMLTRVMGLHEQVNVHITPVIPGPDDIIVICSDGLTNYLSETSIKTIISDLTLSLDEKVDLLIDEANLEGGGDNITVILLERKEEQGRWKRLTKKFLVNEE